MTSAPPGDPEWETEIAAIAREWLLSDVPLAELPTRAIVPLENPDLHDRTAFLEHLRDVRRFRTIDVGQTAAGARVILTSSKFTAPAVAMLVHVLAGVGVTEIVGVGYCGAVDPDISCGDLVLPLAAVRDEGTSARYVPERYPAVADFGLHGALVNAARRHDARFHSGVVFSTDAIMLESTAQMREWGARDVLAVDMETSALLTVARLLRVRAASILVASDHPGLCRRTDPEFLHRGMQNAVRVAFSIF